MRRGTHHTPETLAKISAQGKGKPHGPCSEETKEKMRQTYLAHRAADPNFGPPKRTAEQKAAIGETSKKVWASKTPEEIEAWRINVRAGVRLSRAQKAMRAMVDAAAENGLVEVFDGDTTSHNA